MAPLRPTIAAAAGRLTEAGVASPRTDAEDLAAHLLGVGRGDLQAVIDACVNADLADRLAAVDSSPS